MLKCNVEEIPVAHIDLGKRAQFSQKSEWMFSLVYEISLFTTLLMSLFKDDVCFGR